MDESAEHIDQQNFKGNSALLFGTEHSGLSDCWVGKGKNSLREANFGKEKTKDVFSKGKSGPPGLSEHF